MANRYIAKLNGLVREHFTILGLPKRKCSEVEAKELALLNNKNPYECSFCGYWHIGSND